MISFTLAGEGVALTGNFSVTAAAMRIFFAATGFTSSSSSSSDDDDTSVCEAFPLGVVLTDLDVLLIGAERFRLAGGGVGSCGE